MNGSAHPPILVSDNPVEHRFEVEVDGVRALAAYRMEGDTIVFTHTEVPPELEGRGVGSTLVHAALTSARERNLKVVPQCSFVAHYMRKHPETQNLLLVPGEGAVS